MDKSNPSLEFKNTVLLVKDIQKSKEFYVSILQQEIEMDFGRNVGFKSGLAIWERNYAIELMNDAITKKTDTITTEPTKGHTLELYFEIPTINDFQSGLKEKNIRFVHELITQPWQQRALRFYDPDDYIIEVAEPMWAVVVRLNKEGQTPEEINQKSMMPLEIIKQILKT